MAAGEDEPLGRDLVQDRAIQAPRCFTFGAFTLDVQTKVLTRDKVVVPVGARATELLIALVEHRDRVVSKEELIRIAWPDSVVDRNSLPVAIFALRQIFKEQFLIRNVYGKGYQVIVPVVTHDVMKGADETGGTTASGADQPSIAVMPFVSSGDGSPEILGDGLSEDLIGALSRNRWLRVIARNSTFSFRDTKASVTEIGQRLGARYVLEGSIRRSGDRVRVTAQLNDAGSNSLLVSERYDRVLTDIFSVQDEIAARIVEAVRPVLFEAEQTRSFRTHPDSIDAWTAYQRGVWYLGRWSDEDLQTSLDWFRRAMQIDARHAPSFYGAARLLCRAGSGYSPVAPPDWQVQSERLAEYAVKLDPRDSGTHVALGWSRYMRGELPGAIKAAKEAVELNPSEASAYALLGASLVFNGRPADGIETLQASIDLDPRDPRIPVRQMQIGMGLFFLEDLGAAEDLAAEMIRVWPEYDGSYRLMALVMAETDRFEPALEHLRRTIALSRGPFDDFSHRRMPWYRASDFRRVLSALRRAGWQGPGDPL